MNKVERRRYLASYVSWLRPHVLGVVIVLVLSASGRDWTCFPAIYAHVVDRVLLVQGLTVEARMSSLHWVGGMFLAVIVAARLFDSLRSYRQRQLNAQTVLSLRRSLYERLLFLPLHKLSDLKIGGIISRLSGDVDTTTGLLQLAVVSPSLSLLRLLIAVTILFSLNWRLALTALAVIPGVMLISFTVSQRVRPIFRAIRDDKSDVEGRGARPSAASESSGLSPRNPRRTRIRRGHHSALRRNCSPTAASWCYGSRGSTDALVDLVIVRYGGYLQIQGSAPSATSCFSVVHVPLLNPIWQIVNSFSELQRSLAAMDRVFEVLALPADKPDTPDAVDAQPMSRKSLRQCQLEYRAGEPVVRDFNLTVPGGSVVALVGRSGVGKTMTDLVARFTIPPPDRSWSMAQTSAISLAQLPKLLGVVHQEVFLFDGTVRQHRLRQTRRHRCGNRGRPAAGQRSRIC